VFLLLFKIFPKFLSPLIILLFVYMAGLVVGLFLASAGNKYFYYRLLFFSPGCLCFV
jgi:hypothetical protein